MIAVFFVISVPLGAGTMGTTCADFLKVNLGARPSALGGAYVAAGDDINAIFFNPAGLSSLRANWTCHFTHYQQLVDIKYDTVLIMKQRSGRQVLGGGLLYRHMPPIDNQNGYPAVQVRDLVILVSGAHRFGEPKAEKSIKRVGMNLKIINSVLGGTSANTVACDLGFQVQDFFRRFDFGFSIQNLGPPMKYIEVREPLPLFIRCGLAVQQKVSKLRTCLAMDVTKPMDSGYKFDYGLEARFYRDRVFLRAGNSHEADLIKGGPGNLFENFTLGVGFIRRERDFNVQVDVSYNPADYVATVEETFMVSLTYERK